MNILALFPILGLLLAMTALGGCDHPPSEPVARAQTLPVEVRFRNFIMEGRQPTDLSPKRLSTRTTNGIHVERISFTPEAGHEAVAVLMSPPPDGKPRPVIILQHWLYGSKDSPALVSVQQLLAQSGYVAVAMDARYRGERRPGGQNLEDAMIRAFKTGKGHPWLIDTTYDLLRLTDYLVSRPDVDSDRIGIVGISEGGFEAWMAAVADPRIKVIVSVIGLTRFSQMADLESTSSLFGRAYAEAARMMGHEKANEEVVHALWNRLLPKFNTEFDPVNLVPTLAPRPFLALVHEKDQIVPAAGAVEVFEAVKRSYEAAGVPENAQLRIEPGLSHEDQSMTEWLEALAWVNRWLEPEEPE